MTVLKPFPQRVLIGLAMRASVAWGVRRNTLKKITVDTQRFTMEDYTSIGGRVVSAVDCPATVTCTVGVGDLDFTRSTDVTYDAPRNQIPCDARFFAEDATDVGGDLVWRARYGDNPFTIVSPPGQVPQLLSSDLYTMWYQPHRTWLPQAAVQFTGGQAASSESSIWSTDLDVSDGFGVAACWVLSNTSAGMPLMGFVSGGIDVTVVLDSFDRLVVREDGHTRMFIKFRPDWYMRPVGIAVLYQPEQRRLVLSVNPSNAQATTVHVPVAHPHAVFSGQLGLMWGDSENACELLDVTVWRDQAPRLQRTWQVYSTLYGI